MPKTQIKDGVLSSETFVKATGQYTCPKGTITQFVLDWPEGATFNTQLAINNVKCSCCGEIAVLPTGKFYVKDGVLISEPITTST